MQAALRTHGFDAMHAMDIVPPGGSISMEEMAAQVRTETEALRSSTGTEKVDIVAFSMGTLAARYFIQALEGRSLIRRFVSIAGPHHGTLTAYLYWGKGSRQMRPGSSFLNALNAEENPWGEVEVFSFRTPYDSMVIPSKSSILTGACNRSFNVFAHYRMLYDKKVIEAVAEVLGVI